MPFEDDTSKPVDTNDIVQLLHPGRLSIECIEAVNVARKDQATAATYLRSYLLFQFGCDLNSKTSIIKWTDQLSESRTSKLNFFSEVVSFDINDPVSYIGNNNDIMLKVELWDSPEEDSEVLLAEAVLSVATFLSSDNKNLEEWISIKHPEDASSNCKVRLKFNFQPAMYGMLLAKLFSLSKIHPNYKDIHATLSLKYGGQIARSKTARGDGETRYFGEEELILWIDKTNWFEDLLIVLCSGSNVIGVHEGTSILPIMTELNNERENLAFHSPAEVSRSLSKPTQSGELQVKFDFLRAGLLRVKILEGKNLRGDDFQSQVEPYVVVKSEGKASVLMEKTLPWKVTSSDPKWNEVLTMMVVDHYMLQLICLYRDGFANSEDLLGEAELSLLPVYKTGIIDTWVELKYKNEFGTTVNAGKIHLFLDFTGEHGTAFPQRQSTIASYDDKERLNKRTIALEEPTETNGTDIMLSRRKIQTSPVIETKEKMSSTPSDYDCGFSNEEIRTAFDFLDLDKNGFIGAAELRHILVGMGEMVTDEEIDMMISMLDFNGDGQVNADEFMAMVSDFDPSRDDFEPGKSIISPPHYNNENDDNKGEKGSADVEDADLLKRDVKRKLFSAMVSSKSEIPYRRERFFKVAKDVISFSEVDQGSSRQWRANIQDMANLFSLSAEAVETQDLFRAFTTNHINKIVDLRHILMGLTNFVSGITNDEKCSLAFEFYDERKSGLLTLDEIEQLLVGSHLHQSRSAVLRKAKMVMSSADAHYAGGIRFEQLKEVATKFPNLV
eukprot:CAMPEP_0172421870 /NCGR_PEP_ID=MMETSP1064-20121228/8099_1 /TAXON_ID=202472 /ORGANISM="Aulacoseira subarctica , Strain CCAP 1002/5" /LENGTH=781 /DNA_ID=CAMNT_0013162483 /DNA_START=135 /DNA_END=2476 /DNA_ORIENTATION=-